MTISGAMTSPLHILHLEDRALEAELAQRELRKSGIEFVANRVVTEADFVAGMKDPQLSLILADYSLPAYDGLTALLAARQARPEVPFIFVSGTMGEETAVDALHQGATDYILKQRLFRLGPAVQRAVREREATLEQEHTRLALRDSEMRFRAVWEHSVDGMRLTDAQGTITTVNDAYCRLVRLPRASLEGQPWTVSYQPNTLPSEVMQRYRERFAARSITPRQERRVTLRSGENLDLDMSSSFIEMGGGQVWLLCLFRDVTEKKSLEAQYLRAQRLESIGQLAGGIAHDLNNILSPLMMLGPILREQIHQPDTLEFLDTIESNVRRGADIVRQILLFSRGIKSARIPISPSTLIHECVAMVQQTFPKAISIHSRLANDLWTIEADPTQMQQVLMNLAVNARDAMPHGGTLSFAAENCRLDEATAAQTPHAKAGPYVLWRVTDTGSGIAPDIIDRVFDPFFTTKEVGKGTGLGLSTVLGIVRNHDGFIQVESKPDSGTEFRIYIPATSDNAAPVKTAANPMVQGGGASILLVDDELSVREATRKVLEQMGYRAIVAKEGIEALALFDEHRSEIQLVLTDIMMPKLNGLALIRALKNMDPRIPIVACSGITDQDHTAELKELGVADFLEKPFTVSKLADVLKQVQNHLNDAS